MKDKDFATLTALSPTHRLEDGFETFWKEMLKQIPDDPPMPKALENILRATAKSAFYSGISWSLSVGEDHAAEELKRVIGQDPRFKDN